MWDQLELLIQVSTGIGALTHGGTLFSRRHEVPLYGQFGICLALRGGALLGKAHTGLGEAYGIEVFGLTYFFALVISLIPIAGGLLVSLITLFGFGAALLSRYGIQTGDSLSQSLDRLEHQTE